MEQQTAEQSDILALNDEAPKQPQRQPRRHKSGLPEAYTGDDGRPIVKPVWRASALLYLGDTLWQEGDIVIADIVPNEQMEPLNWAAADLFERWKESLPLNGVGLGQVDIMEAADMLRPDAAKMSSEEFRRAAVKLATELKRRREGLDTPSALQPMVYHAGARGDAPPLNNARVGTGGMGIDKPAIRGTPNTSVQRAPARAMTNQPRSSSGSPA